MHHHSKRERYTAWIARAIIATSIFVTMLYVFDGKLDLFTSAPNPEFADATPSGMLVVPASGASQSSYTGSYTATYTGTYTGSYVPPTPTGLTLTCDAAGTTGTIAWTSAPGATSYLVRADDGASPWTPSRCDGTVNDTGAGDYCWPAAATNPKTFTTQAGHSYTVWVHSNNAAGYNTTPAQGTLTCSAMPSCTVNISPNPLARGGSATVTWSSQNASSMTLATIGPVATAGSSSVSPTVTTSYGGTVSNTTQNISYGANVRVVLGSGSSWSVPADWNNSNNVIECIGGGAGGSRGAAGGGGAYSRATNAVLPMGRTVAYNIGTAGVGWGYGGPTNGGATYFGAYYCYAQGGYVGGDLSLTGGTGGQSSGYGNVNYVGGNGGGASNVWDGIRTFNGGGGGGAGGPNGNGYSGASGVAASVGGNGGYGGAGYGGGGGGGGGFTYYWAYTYGGTGGTAYNGAEWSSAGSGGGGGGGGGGYYGGAGGHGGYYGGGGGGGAQGYAVDGYGGYGRQGVVVITYQPIIYTPQNNTATCPATLTVQTPTAALTLAGGVSSQTVNVGQQSTWTWSSTFGNTYTTIVTLDQADACGNGVGPITWPYGTSASGNYTATWQACTAGRTYNYSYRVTNSAGYIATAPTASVTVRPLPSCTLTPTPATIVRGGSAALAWTSANSTSGSIAPGGTNMSPLASGQVSVAPTVTTTYTGSVTGAGGAGSCQTTVNVTCAPIYQCSGQQITYTDSNCNTTNLNGGVACAAPSYCQAGQAVCINPPPSFTAGTTAGGTPTTGDLEANPQLVRKGTSAKLYWNVSNVASCTVTGNNGETLASGCTGSVCTSGSAGRTTAAINSSVIYSLRCNALSGVTPSSFNHTVTVLPSPEYEEK